MATSRLEEKLWRVGRKDCQAAGMYFSFIVDIYLESLMKEELRTEQAKEPDGSGKQ
jgi:hypothetical protein